MAAKHAFSQRTAHTCAPKTLPLSVTLASWGLLTMSRHPWPPSQAAMKGHGRLDVQRRDGDLMGLHAVPLGQLRPRRITWHPGQVVSHRSPGQ